MKRIIGIYIKSFKLRRRFLKTHKAMNVLLNEYDNIDEIDINMRREYLKCLKFFDKYTTGILDEIKELESANKIKTYIKRGNRIYD